MIWTRFEYWPTWAFYIPLLPFGLILALRNRSLSFFTYVNPGIDLGGFFGESKQAILAKIPAEYLPLQVNLDYTKTLDIRGFFNQIEITLPFIVKPDVGERGTAVAKIHSEQEWLDYFKKQAFGRFIIQQFIDYPEEFGVLYSRAPFEQVGKISSITQKGFLSVVGDGKTTIACLLELSLRGKLQFKRFENEQPELLQTILPKGEVKLLEPIGNHCRGTEFIDANHLHTSELLNAIDLLSKEIAGFYFGRFDLKVPSVSDFKKGKNIVILELNGVSSEPGHIYDKSMNYLKAYRIVALHWMRLAEIARMNRRLRLVQKTSVLKIISVYFNHVIRKKRTVPISKLRSEFDLSSFKSN